VSTWADARRQRSLHNYGTNYILWTIPLKSPFLYKAVYMCTLVLPDSQNISPNTNTVDTMENM